ncbi:MAG TPA: pirin family protein [bacterium]|nr:pirin family protein [bacterium]
MIQRIPAQDRHYKDMGWLKTYWLFSFGDYLDPANMQFGNLRVFNDDFVKAHTGFKTHQHAEMEIVTLVMSGELTHEDSTGSSGTISPGEVQRMTAGTGIRHSEMNHGDEPVNLCQIWFLPDQSGLEPGYVQQNFRERLASNALIPVVSGGNHSEALSIHADITLWIGDFEGGHSSIYEPGSGRGVFVYVIRGKMKVNDTTLEQFDQARITEEQEVRLDAAEPVHFICIETKLE